MYSSLPIVFDIRFVYDNIKLYNVPECRVHLTEASPVGFVHNVQTDFYMQIWFN